MFAYSHATIESNTPGAYVFRVHGSTGFYDLLVQVENQLQLDAWCERFKTRYTAHTFTRLDYLLCSGTYSMAFLSFVECILDTMVVYPRVARQ